MHKMHIHRYFNEQLEINSAAETVQSWSDDIMKKILTGLNG